MSLKYLCTGQEMIILKTPNDLQVALRAHNIIAVEQHPSQEGCAVITHEVVRGKKPSLLLVKHTVQEVVDALHKVENSF